LSAARGAALVLRHLFDEERGGAAAPFFEFLFEFLKRSGTACMIFAFDTT
jgi:hypothetical protein